MDLADKEALMQAIAHAENSLKDATTIRVAAVRAEDDARMMLTQLKAIQRRVRERQEQEGMPPGP